MPAASAAPAPLPAEPPASAVEAMPAPEPAANAVPLDPAVEPAPALSREGTARLRRDFDRFLTRSGRSRTALTGAQREVLFNDYLQWQARQTSAAPR